MPLRMRTQSAGLPATESSGGGTGVRVGRGGRGRRPREDYDERVDDLNGQGNDQGMGANEGVEGSPNGITLLMDNEWQPGQFFINKEFLAVNLRMKMVRECCSSNVGWKNQDCAYMSCCSIDQKVKYTAGLFVGKALTWWNSQIRTLSQEVAVSMSWNEFKFMMIQEFCPIHEMQKLEYELWNHAMVGVSHAAGFGIAGIIGQTKDIYSVSNALADLGASISVMPFSMFKHLGLRNPRPVNMVIEMADRSMQSPKGIVENVLVKIHMFIFSVDFVILDIVEDNKVSIIPGRPMLATA
ncbi:reverse transcriptase domain-containing protein [Tanacetum coccineum]